MKELHIDCPHCGASFDVQLDGEASNMMVFPCARCETPLMYFHGEVSELDRDEFTHLRDRLSRVLNVMVKEDGVVSDVANSLKKMVEISNAKAAERAKSSSHITDDALNELQKNLDEMDADAFLNSL